MIDYSHRYIEPLTVSSVESEDGKTVIIGTSGLVFWRETSHFRFMPKVGELYYIESLGSRIISMQKADGGEYAFAYTEEQLKAQDQALIDSLKTQIKE